MTSRDGTTVRRPLPSGRRPQLAVLRIVASPDRSLVGATYPLNGAAYLFGRSRESEHCVSDQRMSRKHARVSKGPSGYELQDLDTTNGTFLDGRPVVGRRPLDGHVISMGDTLFVYDQPPHPDSMRASPNADPARVRSVSGMSLATSALRSCVATVGPTPGAVLILGETGVGKEVAARAVHEVSGRDGRFVAVNCAAIPVELAESQLFGHYRGAFTGADREQTGYFQSASGGTLFLDEVGELQPILQAKLLRVLEDHVVQPIGNGPPVKVDLRVIAATNADLEQTGFRADLRARLSDWVVRIPPIRDRRADILELWQRFLTADGRSARRMRAEFCEALLLHDWPENARELRKMAQRIDGLVGDADEFELHHLPVELQTPLLPRFEDGTGPRPPATAQPAPTDARPHGSTRDFPVNRPPPSCDDVKAALQAAQGNIKVAAERNDWHRTQLYRWIRRFGIDPDEYR